MSTTEKLYSNRTIYPIENHPNDSRVKLSSNGTVQALTTRMGTGGGNVPLVMIRVSDNEQKDL